MKSCEQREAAKAAASLLYTCLRLSLFHPFSAMGLPNFVCIPDGEAVTF
jgi:hypothetical protein